MYQAIVEDRAKLGVDDVTYALWYLLNINSTAQRVQEAADQLDLNSGPEEPEPPRDIGKRWESIQSGKGGWHGSRRDRIFHTENSADQPLPEHEEAQPPEASEPAPSPGPAICDNPGVRGVKGFLFLNCEHCGKSYSTFFRNYQVTTTCRFCRNPISSDVFQTVKAYVNCKKCEGCKLTYRTNVRADAFSLECKKCGSPIDLLRGKYGHFYTQF